MSDRFVNTGGMLSQASLGAWHTLFVNRPRPYALQQADGTYRWVYQTLSPEIMLEHLRGERTVALSCTDGEGGCRWLCLDLDAPLGVRILVALRTALAGLGLPGLVEASRRGGHLWFFLQEPMPAAIARAGVIAVLQVVEAQAEFALPTPLELYPSAGNTTPGTLGQAVRLPLSIHRLTGRRYPLFDEEGMPCVFTSLEMAVHCVVGQPQLEVTTLRALATVATPATSPRMPLIVAEATPGDWTTPCAAPSSDPGSNVVGEADSARPGPRPGRVGTTSPVIRWVDAHVSVFALLDELAPDCALQRAGRGYVGWCPFHDDRAPDEQGRPGMPSFYVVHDRRYGWSWRCLSSNCPQALGPMRHAFRLFQELLDLPCAPAIVAACARWPAADALARGPAVPAPAIPDVSVERSRD